MEAGVVEAGFVEVGVAEMGVATAEGSTGGAWSGETVGDVAPPAAESERGPAGMIGARSRVEGEPGIGGPAFGRVDPAGDGGGDDT